MNISSLNLSKLKTWALATAASSALMLSATALADQKMVGYQASWGSIEQVDYDNLSHIIYSFALPRTSGTVIALSAESDTKLRTLVERAHAKDVKVLLAIGGWNNGDDSAFEAFSQTAAGVNNFVADTSYLVDTYNLDGIDLDWEYPDAKWKWNNLVNAMAPAMHNKGKLLTAAVAAYGAGADTVGNIDSLDFVNVMMYECHCGEEEAPFWQMEESLAYWKNRGLEAERLMLGIPFYGGGGQDVSIHKRKAQASLEHAGGIMIWEISQDTSGMIAEIASVLRSGNTGASNPIGGQCSDWAQGTNYSAGDQVAFEGSYYTASNPNPGYIPNVSTWFWDKTPDACQPVTPPDSQCSDWAQGTNYNTGDSVNYQGQSYTATNPNPGYIPTTSTWFWDATPEACSNGGSGGGTLEPTCDDWVSGQNYSTGDMVEFEGQRYISTNDNPGYIPNISTWFWSPTTESCTNNGDNGGTPPVTGSCDGPWYSAHLTNYESYPDPGSDECILYNGCTWAGQFAGLSGVQPESWVAANNIIAVHSKDWAWLNGKTLNLRQGGNAIQAVVYDMCADSDCNNCCTNNLGGDGFLIDVEKYTMQRFGTGSGIVEWQVCE